MIQDIKIQMPSADGGQMPNLNFGILSFDIHLNFGLCHLTFSADPLTLCPSFLGSSGIPVVTFHIPSRLGESACERMRGVIISFPLP
jgi:hypothetical protein